MESQYVSQVVLAGLQEKNTAITFDLRTKVKVPADHPVASVQREREINGKGKLLLRFKVNLMRYQYFFCVPMLTLEYLGKKVCTFNNRGFVKNATHLFNNADLVVWFYRECCIWKG